MLSARGRTATVMAVVAAIIIVDGHLRGVVVSNASAIQVVEQALGHDRARLPFLSEAVPPRGWWPTLAAFAADSRPATEQAVMRALSRSPAATSALRVDQLLVVSAVALSSRCDVAAAALRISAQTSHDSAIGYVRLARALAQSTCDANSRLSTAAYRAAANTKGKSFLDKTSRAEAWYRIGRSAAVKGDADGAGAAYRSALSVDPTDSSGGYGWMSAVALAEIEMQKENVTAARQLLAVAARMPDFYHRRAETARLLAQTFSATNDVTAARRIVNDALARDPGYEPLRIAKRQLEAGGR